MYWKIVSARAPWLRLVGIGVVAATLLSTPRAEAQPVLSTRLIEKTLSDYYEKTASDTLAYFLRPDQYKILVDTQLDAGVAPEIEKLKAELASDPLPGTTTRSFQVTPEELVGKYESLNHKRRVLVVLSPDVPAEKEALVKDMLTGKLRLNLAGNLDSYLLRRSEVESGPDSTGRVPASVSSTADTSRLLAMIVLSLAALAGIVIFFLRKIRARKAAEDEQSGSAPQTLKAEMPEDTVSPNFGLPSKIEGDKGSSTESVGTAMRMGGPPMFPGNMESLEAAEGVLDKIIELAKSYPGIVSDAMQASLERGAEYLPRIAAVIEMLGSERALEVFHEVPQRVWSVVGKHMTEVPFTPENPVKLDDIGLMYRFLFAHVIENKGYDSYSGMLSSLNGKTPAEIARSLEGEDPKAIAIVLSAVSQSMAFDILPKVDARARTQVLAHMSKMQHISVNDIKSVEARLKAKLDGSGNQSSLKVENESRIFMSMSLLSPHEEEALFATMLLGDTDLERRARRYRLYPAHLKLLRQDLIRDEMTPMSTDEIAKILRGLEASIRTRVLGVLSDKKAEIVKDTLKDMTNLSMTGEFAGARRAFLDFLYQRYVAKDPDFADSIFDNGGSTDKKEAA